MPELDPGPGRAVRRSPILDPDLQSQPLRGCAPTKTLSGETAVKLKKPRGESPVKPQNPHARKAVSPLRCPLPVSHAHFHT